MTPFDLRFGRSHVVRLHDYQPKNPTPNSVAEDEARQEILQGLGLKGLGHGQVDGQDVFVGIIPQHGNCYPELIINTGRGNDTPVDRKIIEVIQQALATMLKKQDMPEGNLKYLYDPKQDCGGFFEQEGTQTKAMVGLGMYHFGPTHEDGRRTSGALVL